jgi:hypothetical protein
LVKVTKAEVAVLILGLILFIYFFFIVPPTPVYFDEDDPTQILPRDALYDPETGKWIIGWERSSVVIIVPFVWIFSLFYMAMGDDMPKLREIPKEIYGDIRWKLKDMLREHREWMEKRKK